MESPHLLFNIHSEQEWNDELLPKLKIILSHNFDGEMVVVGYPNHIISKLDLNKQRISFKDNTTDEVEKIIYNDFYLLDEDDKILFEKTTFLIELYNHIFNN